MRLEGTSYEAFIMFMSFIGSCVKRDSTSKFTNRSVERSRIFWIFCTKSIELVRCDSDIPVKGCSVCAVKRDKLYVGECMALTIGPRGMFGLCIFVKRPIVSYTPRQLIPLPSTNTIIPHWKIRICLTTTYLSCNNQFYDQTSEAAMGFPISLVIANIFMKHFEKEALRKTPKNQKFDSVM